MNRILKSLLFCAFSVLAVTSAFGQEKTSADEKAAYREVVTKRADKIVADLGLFDNGKQTVVRDIIAQQYIDLNAIHDARNAAIKEAKQLHQNDQEKSKASVEKLEKRANKKLSKLHKKYISKLSKNLSEQQVDMVKDGMTYKVLPITYKGYQEMLPNLAPEQWKQILAYLTEAREHAMDAESSEKKHAWFGKYKGKINNYLSAAGIDMNKASKEWQQRIKEEAAKKENR